MWLDLGGCRVCKSGFLILVTHKELIWNMDTCEIFRDCRTTISLSSLNVSSLYTIACGLWISKWAKSGVWAMRVSSRIQSHITNNPEIFICGPSQLFFWMPWYVCASTCHTHLCDWSTPPCCLCTAVFKLLWKWSNGLYSAGLLLMGWFLRCTAVLGPHPLLIPTIAAVKKL